VILIPWLAAGSLAIAHFAAIAVYALRDFSRSHLRELLQARNALPVYEEISERSLSAATAAEHFRVAFTTIAGVLATIYLLETTGGQDAPAVGVRLSYGALGLILMWLTIIWLPSAMAHIWAEPFLVATWPLWRVACGATKPLVMIAHLVEVVLRKISRMPEKQLTEEQLEDEIREVVNEGQREGLIEEDAREMIESVIALGEISISEIMTPRTDMISLPNDIPWDEAIKRAAASGHTRIPVHGASRDEIVGILHIKDLFQEQARAARSGRRTLAQLLRPPLFVPETKPVNDMLQEFQRSRSHIAVVLDEYGGVSGLVTIEDVLEEIVGEIADEHDEAASDGLRQIDEKTCEAFANVHISEINERLHIALPETDNYDTIGGFLFHHLGRIPHTGEEVSYNGVKITVVETTRRRVNRVLIEVVPPADETSEESADEQVKSAE
jgi:CBS domain containing-hemolysin-like protein